MPNMKTVGQRNLKLLGGQEKTDGQPDGQPDSSIPPLQLCCAGLYKIHMHSFRKKKDVHNLWTALPKFQVS
jgi:hypothetical protein